MTRTKQKKIKEIGQEMAFWEVDNFHNIREFFKKEKGGYSSCTSWFFYYIANLWKKSSLEPHMKLASEVVEG